MIEASTIIQIHLELLQIARAKRENDLLLEKIEKVINGDCTNLVKVNIIKGLFMEKKTKKACTCTKKQES